MARDQTRSLGRWLAGGVAVMAVLAGEIAQTSAVVADAASAPAGTIMTIAGGIGGPALATQVDLAATGAAFANGHLYVSGGVVRQIDPRTDWLTNPVGDGANGFTPNGRPAAGGPVSTDVVTDDHMGNLVVFDSGRVRVVAASTGRFYGRAMSAGNIYTVAGTGVTGSSGDGGPALKARFIGVTGIGVDRSGNLLISDTGASRLRVIAERSGTFYGHKMTTGDIYTIAGGGHHGLGDRGPATKAILNPYGAVAFDRFGNVIVAHDSANRVRVIAARSGTFYGRRMTRGDIYTIVGTGRQGFSGDTGAATRARLSNPLGVAVDPAGNVLIADSGNRRVRVVAARSGTFYGRKMARGHIYTRAGTGRVGPSGIGGLATSAALGGPFSVALDSNGNIIIPDGNGVRLVAERAGSFYGQAMRPGHIYTIAGNGNGLNYSGDGRPALTAQLGAAFGLAVDGHQNIIETDLYTNRIRVVAGSTGTFYGMAMTAGDIYTVAGTGTAGFTGDGDPAVDAQLNEPWGVAVATGSFYGMAMTAGDIYTIAGTGQPAFSGDGGPATDAGIGTYYSAGMAIDGNGNILIVDGGNHRIRMIAEQTGSFYGQQLTAGDIYTVAGGGSSYPGDGGPATSASFGTILGITVDAAGNLLTATDNAVRVAATQSGTFYGQHMTAGDIYTIAGRGADFGDGIPAVNARFGDARGPLVDQFGNVIVVESSNLCKVRVIAESSGVFYGIPMTAGDIYTVAGDGNPGYSGDGGPATEAELQPLSIALDQAGNLLIGGAVRLRKVTK
jgi:hypothetical protein